MLKLVAVDAVQNEAVVGVALGVYGCCLTVSASADRTTNGRPRKMQTTDAGGLHLLDLTAKIEIFYRQLVLHMLNPALFLSLT